VDLGEKIELRNDGRRSVVVVGYEREPYLRITPAGVWENRRSPAVFLNRTLRPDRMLSQTWSAAKQQPVAVDRE
jgi:hypothetical protein